MPVDTHDLRWAFADTLPLALRTEMPEWRPNDLLTLAQAADEFNVSVRFLRTLRNERRVRSYVVRRASANDVSLD